MCSGIFAARAGLCVARAGSPQAGALEGLRLSRDSGFRRLARCGRGAAAEALSLLLSGAWLRFGGASPGRRTARRAAAHFRAVRALELGSNERRPLPRLQTLPGQSKPSLPELAQSSRHTPWQRTTGNALLASNVVFETFPANLASTREVQATRHRSQPKLTVLGKPEKVGTMDVGELGTLLEADTARSETDPPQHDGWRE